MTATPLIPVAEAQRRLLALAPDLPVEQVALTAAAGRPVAADVLALRTQPDADLSAMDGYAIRFADLPGPFNRIGESAAGRPFTTEIGERQTARIFTGARLPAGADTVLVQEDARCEGDRVLLTGDGSRAAGQWVRPRGLDFADGDRLVTQGEIATPARIALAAIGGHATIPVRRRVRIAIAATGDELGAPGTSLAAGQLPEANGPMLAALFANLPAHIDDLGILPDDRAVLAHAFAATTADLLIVTGGASVGDHDLVAPALVDAGAAIDFHRVAMRPGRPLLAGRMRDTVVLGLPGNPVSAFVTALLFALPLVRHLSGDPHPWPRTRTMPLGDALAANDGRQDYLRAAQAPDGTVASLGRQDSSMLATLSRADCLIVRAPHAPAALAGSLVETIAIA